MVEPEVEVSEDWLVAAKRFYHREAVEKKSGGIRSQFVQNYRALAKRMELQGESKLLDAGCGCGEVIEAMQGSGITVVGVDISITSLQETRKSCPNSLLVCADLHQLPFRDGIFQGLTAISSLEFCRNRNRSWQEMVRTLAPKARAYVEGRNGDFIFYRLVAPIRAILEGWGMLASYPAEGFRDMKLFEWEELFKKGQVKLKKRMDSLWPWNYGGFGTRAKNILIHICKTFLSRKHHYLIGYLLEKNID